MIRPKLIFIPIVAALMMGSYFWHAEKQASKFDSRLWEVSEDYRQEVVGTLQAYVLKTGQTREEVRQLLPMSLVEERNYGCCHSFWEYGSAVSYDVFEITPSKELTVVYSINNKVTNFYIDRSYNFIF